ncbi:MAG: hypothetical protein FJX76_25525 [Armatimonadetes bacterium]|nr:hypothetical protein [Armatimonadota bacterium]
MSNDGDESYLVQKAAAALHEDVLAAGVFGLQDVVHAEKLGIVCGELAGAILGGDALAQGVGAAVGSRLAKEEAARRMEMSLTLLVAVTADAIHVLCWEDDEPGREVHRFPRATSEVTITRFGLSRIVRLRDPASGAEINLHGTAAFFLPRSKPDGIVLHLLGAG